MEMLIDMDNKEVTFVLSNGGVVCGRIPNELLKNYKLVPFVAMYLKYDSLEFIENLNESR